MTKKFAVLLMCVGLSSSVFAQSKPAKRLADSLAVFKTIMDKQEIPKTILDKAACVLVYPSVKKVGIGIGVSYGRGVLVCRTGANMDGKWGAPIMYTLDTSSLG